MTQGGNLLSSVEMTGDAPMITAIYVPRSYFTDHTPAAVPVLLRALRAGAVLTIDWATLQYMEHVPAYVIAGVAIDSLLILGGLESRDWLAFKGRYYFRSSLAVLLVVYVLICASPFILSLASPTIPPQAETHAAPDQLAPAKPILATPTPTQARRMNWQTVLGMVGWFEQQGNLRGIKTNILVTAASDNEWLQIVLVEILKRAFSGITFLQKPDNKDLDWTTPQNGTAGILVRGRDTLAKSFTDVMEGCFILHKTTADIEKIALYYKLADVTWIDIGPGAPWKEAPNSAVASTWGGPPCYDR